MNKHEKSVKNIENIINVDRSEPVELEISMMIQDNENGRQIYSGIQIYVPGSDMPVFISAGELKLLADAADNYCSELLQAKKPVEKKTSAKVKKTG